jgi:hypothetical protein
LIYPDEVLNSAHAATFCFIFDFWISFMLGKHLITRSQFASPPTGSFYSTLCSVIFKLVKKRPHIVLTPQLLDLFRIRELTPDLSNYILSTITRHHQMSSYSNDFTLIFNFLHLILKIQYLNMPLLTKYGET